MTTDKSNLILEYLRKVKLANKELTKKEAFKDLLNRLYTSDPEITKVINKITLGAETTVLNIPRKDKVHRGSADTLYNNIIIEFENNLKITLDHAKEQLAGYLLGKFNSGEGYNFTLIASDFITWRIYAPAVECLDKLDELKEDELTLNEISSASFVLTEKNAEEFYYWIDRFLFKEEKHKATLKRIEEQFGYQSNVFIESFREMNDWFNEAKKFGEVQVSYEQWNKFLSIAYGSFDGSESIFIIHTYLSVFAKMLAYSIISNDDYIDDDELKGILDGSIFHKYNISNFVENDFFHWVVNDRNFRKLKKAFRLIAQEISTYDFDNVDEDVLKGVYQELIDLDTRHALGEYYTPDWLCERIVKEFELKPTDRILDPACGSGSFLRAAIHRLKELNPKIDSVEIIEQIYGIDIHPLSVQISKTTLLLSLGKDISKAKYPIHLNVILSNTLRSPEGVKNLFGNEFQLSIDKEKFLLTTEILEDDKLFDEALNICDELAEQTLGKKLETEDVFENIFRNNFSARTGSKSGANKQVIDSFYKVYSGLKSVKESGRDSIWKFIVQNSYKPYFLAGKFDYVIGNPPWFTYSSIKNEEYQDLLNDVATIYEVKPERRANYPHLEIAAIFLAYCSHYFLKNTGRISFVLPRSFISADHHENTRNGKAKGFCVDEIWDLNLVAPLFRIPSCVFIGHKIDDRLKNPVTNFEGKSFSGKLPENNCNLKIAEKELIEETVKWHLIKRGTTSAYSTKKSKSSTKTNPYRSLFKQGATIVPRGFYFIELDQEFPPDFEGRILNIKTSEEADKEAKKPWKGLGLKGKIESHFLFRTALSKSILPFALFKPELVVLPVMIEKENDGFKKVKLYSSTELMREGHLNASRWFSNTENIWEINKTEKSKKMSSNDRLNFQKGLTDQDLNSKYIVLYNSSAKDANAVVVDRSKFDLEFLVDHKAYLLSVNSKNECNYLVSILNSNIANHMIKDFQSKGLFGARDVHKKILDIYYPEFDNENSVHQELAKLGEEAHKKVEIYLKNNPPQNNLSAVHLGRIRLAIKKDLTAEMKEIDKLVKKVIG